MDRPTMTVEEYATVMGVSRGSAYEAVRTGEVDVIRIGRRIVVPTAPVRFKLGLDQPRAGAA